MAASRSASTPSMPMPTPRPYPQRAIQSLQPGKPQVARLQLCSAAPGPVTGALHALQHAVGEELVIEGALHVTALQAGSCLSRYLELQSFADGSAPPPKADATSTQAAAVCVATPSEPNEESDVGRLLRQNLRYAANSFSNLSNSAEELLEDAERHLQCTPTHLLTASDAWQPLQAAEAVRRRRRAMYLVTIRRGRRTLQRLLPLDLVTTSLASVASLSSVDAWSSWDEGPLQGRKHK